MWMCVVRSFVFYFSTISNYALCQRILLTDAIRRICCESKWKNPTQEQNLNSSAMIELNWKTKKKKKKEKSFFSVILFQALKIVTAPKLNPIEILLDHFSFREEIHLFFGLLCFFFRAASRCTRPGKKICTTAIFICGTMRERSMRFGHDASVHA